MGVKVSVIGPLKPLGLKVLPPVTPEPLHVPVIPLCVVLSVMGASEAQRVVGETDKVGVTNGLTVMVNVCGVPLHVGELPDVGVTVMVAVIAEAVALVAVKEAMSPVPLAAKPIAVLLLLQLNVAPAEPLKLMAVTA